MLKKILFTLLFLSFPSSIYADFFHPYGDSTDNRFFDTLGYGISSLPTNGNCPNCLEYSLSDINGGYTTDILSEVSIEEISERDSVYGLIRKANMYTSVSLPPFSAVDFIYWYKNSSGEVLNIPSLGVFLSKSNIQNGDLRNVLDVKGDMEEIPFKIYTWDYKRVGVVKKYLGLGIVNSNAIGTFVLDTVEVKSPILFEKWEAEVQGENAIIRVYVRNVTEFPLSNIEYRHSGHFSKRNFEPNEIHKYEYNISLEDSRSFGYASIYVPNSRKECAVHGEHMESMYIGDSAIVYGVRESNDLYRNYVASRVKPWGEAFCITRIPFTLYSSEMILEEEVIEESEPLIKDIVEIEQPSVLGIQSLPKTGHLSILFFLPLLFVVVVLLVWYYHMRRI